LLLRLGSLTQKDRFWTRKADLYPLQYSLKTPVYSYFSKNQRSAAFCEPFVSHEHVEHVVKTRYGVKPSPGPGSYNPKEGAYFDVGRASFASKTVRNLQKGLPGQDAPPPGAYNVLIPLGKNAKGMSFKWTGRPNTDHMSAYLTKITATRARCI
jgi:hypothetical protein